MSATEHDQEVLREEIRELFNGLGDYWAADWFDDLGGNLFDEDGNLQRWVIDGFATAEQVTEGFAVAAEGIGFITHMAMRDANERIQRAREHLVRYAGRQDADHAG